MSAAPATAHTAYGLALQIRPVDPTDADRYAAMIARLSDLSRYNRFMGAKPSFTNRELRLLTRVDHRTSDALLAVDPTDGRAIAEARYAMWPREPDAAEIAFVVADEWQRQGIASMLGADIVRRAAAQGFSRMTATTFAGNTSARNVLRRLGFVTRSIGSGVVDLELELRPGRAGSR